MCLKVFQYSANTLEELQNIILKLEKTQVAVPQNVVRRII